MKLFTTRTNYVISVENIRKMNNGIDVRVHPYCAGVDNVFKAVISIVSAHKLQWDAISACCWNKGVRQSSTLNDVIPASTVGLY